MSEYLGLTEDQKATWATLREEHKAEMAPLREEGRGLHTSLSSTMDAANPDPAAVGAATLAMKQHRDKVKAAEDSFQARLAGTLSADQRTKFEAFKAAHQGGRGHGFRGHRGHKPAGPDASSSGPQAPVEG
jgi:Spy/CpxP family protein refolding chaperone